MNTDDSRQQSNRLMARISLLIGLGNLLANIVRILSSGNHPKL